MFDKLHEKAPWHDGSFQVWQEEYSALTPWHYRDGTNLFMSPVELNPDDKFLADKFARPNGRSAADALGDQEQAEKSEGQG